jgi:phospholipid-binding lipoprotein MlaA
MSWKMRSLRPITVMGLIGLLAGCASVPDGYRDPRDPWEPYNRGMHQFNTDFDDAFFKPVARGYRAITPEPLDRGITNFFSNLRDFTSAVNNLLQLKLSRTVSDVGRILVNSTIGLLGFIDVASNMDLPSYKEDFGQTLGYWGLGPGPYFVLPILGPSTVADTIGIIPDWYTQPVAYIDDSGTQWALVLLYAIDKRSDLLTASKVLEEAALDPYVFARDAYLQKRRNDTYDGNPPLDDQYWQEDQPPADDEAPPPEPLAE